MKSAKVGRIAGVYVSCPHCEMGLRSNVGAQMLTESDFMPGEHVTCSCCKKSFQFPRKAFCPRK